MKVELKNKVIPHRPDGYPNFARLGCLVENGGKPDDVFNVFTEQEIVELVNRCIYQLEYQRDSHKKHQERQRDFEAPIKAALKTLYPGTSWAKATPEQLEHAMQVAYPGTKNQIGLLSNKDKETK